MFVEKQQSLISNNQQGSTLLEALISIVVLALGALALLGLQLRTLAESQTSVSRSQAVRLIEDLGERIKANPGTFAQRANYIVGFGAPPAAATDCSSANCTPVQLAAWDVNRWKISVANTMPAGDASVFQLASDPAQLGVVVAWRANEKDNSADYLTVQSLGQTIPVACPAQRICHLVFVKR